LLLTIEVEHVPKVQIVPQQGRLAYLPIDAALTLCAQCRFPPHTPTPFLGAGAGYDGPLTSIGELQLQPQYGGGGPDHHVVTESDVAPELERQRVVPTVTHYQAQCHLTIEAWATAENE
jgi:hypothetical protein